MAKKSAGILLYRKRNELWEVFLAHPGGPVWRKKDEGAWTIPKGEFTDDEEPLEAAKREFEEEIGSAVDGDFVAMTPFKQAGGKLVYAWAVEGDCDPSKLKSNSFTIEWPPKTGRFRSFPEVDKADWFPLELARRKMLPSQLPLLDELERKISAETTELTEDTENKENKKE